MRRTNVKTTIISITLGLTVFALSWLAMLVFWNIDGKPQWRGFTYFVSFLFGDSIFLPILAGSLFAYVKLSGLARHTYAQERFAWIISMISALAGMFMQASWLLSNHTELNWTIPRLHHFNAAGWWHAGFFVFMFALVGYLFTRFLIAR